MKLTLGRSLSDAPTAMPFLAVAGGQTEPSVSSAFTASLDAATSTSISGLSHTNWSRYAESAVYWP